MAARSAFDEAVWIPGEPLDPGTDTMSTKELTDRLLFAEKALANLQIGDIPMGALMKNLEQNWLPDPNTLFAGGSISNDSLAITWYWGQVAAAGGLVLSSTPKLGVIRNSAGNYTVSYPAFKSTPVVMALPQVAVTGMRYGSKTVSAVNFIMSADSDFDFIIGGK